MIILFFIIVLIRFNFVESYNKKFFSNFVISCKYNNKVIKSMIYEKRKELNALHSNDREGYSKVCLDNLSQSSTDELINFVRESTSQIIEINLEYLYFLSVVINLIINYYLSEAINIKSKEELLRICLKNIVLPVMVHDFCKLIFDILKEIQGML